MNKKLIWLLAVTWTAAILLVSGWHLWDVYKNTLASARIQLLDSAEKDLLTYRRTAVQKDVHVPITEEILPDPDLSHLADRDTTTGTDLEPTAMDPLYLTHQLLDLDDKQTDQAGRITSLNPLRPENTPDRWETEALHSFEQGATEVVELAMIGTTEYLRLMQPLYAEATCLKCHDDQDLVAGDLLGGISAAISMEPHWAAVYRHMATLVAGYLLILVLGLGGIGYGALRVSYRLREQERVAGMLAERERYYRKLLEGLYESIMVIDRNFVVTDLYSTLPETAGHTREETIGKHCFEISHNLIEPCFEHGETCQLLTVFETGEPQSCRHIHRGGDGSLTHVDIALSPLKDREGNVTHVIEAMRDISDLIESSQALRVEKELAQKYLDIAGVAIVVLDVGGCITLINRRGLELLGYEEAELIGKNWFQTCLPERLREQVSGVFEQLMTGAVESQEYFENPVITKDGAERDFSWHNTVIRDANGNITGSLSSGEDVTERKLVEEERELLRSAIEQTGEVVVITDVAGTIHYVNPSFERVTGYTRAEAVSQNLLQLTSGEQDESFYSEMWATLRRGEVWKGQFINRKKDGSTYIEEATLSPVKDSSGAIINYVAVKHDITRRLQLSEEKDKIEEQYHQAQKVESIGRLAGGVSHDLNNLLTPILGYCQLLQDDSALNEKQQEFVNHILSAGLRARDLVRQLLAFSRKQTLEYKPVNLNETLAGFEKLLQRTIREDIVIEITAAPDLRMVMADTGQIEQVIMNLAVNASDAMPEGGTLTFETMMVELDEHYAAMHTGVKPGRYVMLAVSDTGCGMDEKVREQLFEPFFSTKGELGTGLGLATVYGIIKQHDGNIWVYSEPGRGTTFKIYLPLSDDTHEDMKPAAARVTELKGTETILLVEDNEQVLQLARHFLQNMGYTVLAAENGFKALKILESHTGPLHLLLTDVVMPEMNGRELVEKSSKILPALKVLYMSGYTDNVIANRGVLDAGVAFIQKPFTGLDLAAKVREVLDGK